MVWWQVSAVQGMSENDVEDEMKERGLKIGRSADHNRKVLFFVTLVTGPRRSLQHTMEHLVLTRGGAFIGGSIWV